MALHHELHVGGSENALNWLRAAVIVALIITGTLSAQAGGARKITAILRIVIGGAIAMAVTFGIGKLFGVVGL